MDKSLNQLEADVEAARAKFAADMAVARSGETRSQFFTDAQQDLRHLKDTVMANAAGSAKSKAADLVETIKAKAAQNPAAVLAIAAGVGWRIYKSPPIASTLVGLGLYSLLKSDAVPTQNPLETAKRRAKEQIEFAAEAARSGAASVTNSVVETVDEMTQPAREATGEVLSLARRQLHDAQDAIADTAKRAKANLSASFDDNRLGGAGQHTRADNSRLQDTALLAFAGIAVAASLGLAWQKRSEPVE
jgi:hypothetical protein